MNADKLCEMWDEGYENNALDPGDIFNKTISYCFELERKIKALEKSVEQPERKEHMKTSEEILKPYIVGVINVPVINKSDALIAKEEYRSQGLPTEEEIEKELNQCFDENKEMDRLRSDGLKWTYIHGFMDCAKWVIERTIGRDKGMSK